MKTSHLQGASLAIRLTIIRFGFANGIASLLCIAGIAAWGWYVPHMHAQLAARQQALVRAQQILPSTSTTAPAKEGASAEDRLAHFYDHLGEKRYVEQQVRTLFAVANKTQLNLNQADYKTGFDANGRYHTYQILLPVKGSYDAVRQFCEQTLLAIPFASLDEMSFKRDAIGNRTLEAKLRFTLYLADAPAATPFGPEAMARDKRP